MTRTRSYKSHLNEALQDEKEAAAYINAAAEEGDIEILLLAIRDVADAQGGIGRLAEKTGLNRESLYKTLSKRGNPRLKGLKEVLEVFGLGFRVAPITPPTKPKRRAVL